jgi:GntR family transcriptional regulator
MVTSSFSPDDSVSIGRGRRGAGGRRRGWDAVGSGGGELAGGAHGGGGGELDFAKNFVAFRVYHHSNTPMSLALSISAASDVPIFRQIVQQIHRAVALGQLQVGEQVPAVRTLAEILVINPNTVARSYQELIRDGVLESRSGRGVFVTERRQVFSQAERLRRLEHAAAQLCHEGVMLSAGQPEIREILEIQWKEIQRETRTIETREEGKRK